jgi:hypothetical protein
MSVIVVSGALANRPRNGGAPGRVCWALGLKRLGCEVYFVEQVAPSRCVDRVGKRCDSERSVNLHTLDVTERLVWQHLGAGAGTRRRSIGLRGRPWWISPGRPTCSSTSAAT